MATVAAASIKWKTVSAGTSSAGLQLPGGATRITLQNRGDQPVYARFGPPGIVATSSDFVIAASATETFQMAKAGQHQQVHLLAESGSQDVVILVDNAGAK